MTSSETTSLKSFFIVSMVSAIVTSIVSLGAMTLARDYREHSSGDSIVPHTNMSANPYAPVRSLRPAFVEERNDAARKEEARKKSEARKEAAKKEVLRKRAENAKKAKETQRIERLREAKLYEKQAVSR